MKHSTKRMFSLLMSAVFIIGALIVFSSFIKPIYQTINEKRSDVNSKEKVLADTQNTIDQVQGLLANYKNLEQLQKDISLSLPQDQSIASALYQLSALALNNGLSIDSINVSEPSIMSMSASEDNSLLKGIGTINFALKAVGSYEALGNFLDKIETNIRVFDLATLKIEKVSEKSSNTFNFNIGVDTYHISD
jgi:Tfp pilus assembly protein PilO